jgi:hypothetical protein
MVALTEKNHLNDVKMTLGRMAIIPDGHPAGIPVLAAAMQETL